MILEPFEEMLKREGYWTTEIQLLLFREIEKYLADNNMDRKDFAKKLGVSKGYVSQILNGEYDHKISKLVRLSLAMDMAPELVLTKLEDKISLVMEKHPLKDIYSRNIPSEPSEKKFDKLELLPIPQYA